MESWLRNLSLIVLCAKRTWDSGSETLGGSKEPGIALGLSQMADAEAGAPEMGSTVPEEPTEEIVDEIEGVDDKDSPSARARGEDTEEEVVKEVAPPTRVIYVVVKDLAAFDLASPISALPMVSIARARPPLLCPIR